MFLCMYRSRYIVWLIVVEVVLSLGHISVELLHYAAG